MYNMLFGKNPATAALLQILGKTEADFGRFRDVFLGDGLIAVYTRNGGGNRDDYQEVFEEMRKHPNFVGDEDDSFDCTYCTYYFTYPEEYKEILTQLQDADKFDPGKMWTEFFEKFNGGKNG